MAPKAKQPAVEEPVVKAEESEDEPAEPEIVKKCLRAAGQLYYGDCKAGYKKRKGRWIRHGFGRQVTSGLAPIGIGPSGQPAFETVVLNTYEGNWEEDQPSGHGHYKWSDGSSYEGNIADGQMHGHGRFAWPDGSAYEGAWHQGGMHGQGRFDSQFDGGRIMQGRFHRNCFLKSNGQWIDVLKHIRNSEVKHILEGNPLADAAEAASKAASKRRPGHGSVVAGLSPRGVPSAGAALVRRCTAGSRWQGERTLGSVLATAINSNLTPLVLAEESAPCSALRYFLDSGSVTDPSQMCVSIRHAATRHRRQRDYKRLFFDAVQSSMLSGSYFALVFEDDDGASALSDQTEDQDWFHRDSSGGAMQALPEEWRLASFFDDASLPPEILSPLPFNARGRAMRFLPEEVAKSSAPCQVPLVPDGAPQAQPTPEGGADEEAAALAVAEAEKAATAARNLAKKAAAQLPPVSNVGPTGHVFEPSPEEGGGFHTTSVMGMPLVHQLRPALVATGRLPDGLDEMHVRKWVKDRFSRHVSVHRLAVVIVGAEPPSP
eukprot:TRINITY_DN59245_c0_g1_i1.p1 TRINITY_DN59245_c0_g1~~TRINITY_DN59245_c0_g1_i1.p1  ORF type:complete len:552 (+),score=107.17 TRINITY_DN59245_c0_g1_i1:23-1657(+)